jgi:hypothetical protein
MRVNHMRGVLMGHITDASLVPSRDVLRNHYEDGRVKVIRQDAAALRWLQRGTKTQSGTSSKGLRTGSRLHDDHQSDRCWSRRVPRRPVKPRET